MKVNSSMKRLLAFAVAIGITAHAGIEKSAGVVPSAEGRQKAKGDNDDAGRMLEEMLNGLLGGGGDRKNETLMNKHARELLEGHQPGSVAAAQATFVIRDAERAGRPLGFATGVNANGWLVTKASEVKIIGDLQVEVRGQWLTAKVTRTWKDHDLALLKIDCQDLPVAQWSALPPPEVGTFITAVAPVGRDAIAIGVVSVAARNIRTQGRGFLGVRLESDDKGLKIGSVEPKSAAEQAGVTPGDRIVELDGRKPDSIFGFTKSISNKKAGDLIRLKVQRGPALVEKEIALGDLASNNIGRGPSRREARMSAMGSTVSERKGDFPNVIQTDFPLDASQCGGPVTDLDGNVIGIVIARSGRIETLVLPSEAIVAALKEVDFSK